MLRKFTILLLLLTLPWRLWAAEGMGLQVMQQAVNVAAAKSDDAMSMMDDCPMRKNQLSQSENAANAASENGTCKACQLCMSFGAPDTGPLFSALDPQAVPPVISSRPFTSAEIRRNAKPPIFCV